jgi:uncharacterized LabA/DUF88 family protein
MNSRPPRLAQTRAPVTPIHRGPQALPSQQYGPPPQYGVPIQHAPNAALLIDFDNVTMGIRSDLAAELRSLLSSDIIKGKVAVQRAYADWRRYPQYIVPLAESSIDMIMAPAYGSSKKNATDIRLAVDAIELVFTRSEIGTYILLSGDSDFASLVTKLKEYGKYVIGVGIRESSSDLLVMNCDEYYSYNALAGLVKQSDEDVAKWDPWELVVEAIGRMKKNGDVMRSDRLKQVMQDIDASFDEKTYGYSKFSKFVSDASEKSLLTITKLENGQLEVGPGSGAPAAATAGAAPRRVAAPVEENGSREDRGRRGRRGGRGRGRDREERGERPERDASSVLPAADGTPAAAGAREQDAEVETDLDVESPSASAAPPVQRAEPAQRPDRTPRHSTPRPEAPPRTTVTARVEPAPRAQSPRDERPPRSEGAARAEVAPRGDIGLTGERLTRQEAFDLVRRATAALVSGDDATPSREVRAKAFELLGRDSESLSERNFERILRDAHDQEVIDLRRRGSDFEVAFPAAVAPVAEQLNRAAAAHTAAVAAAAPVVAPTPRGMGHRSAPARGGRPAGRGSLASPPPELLMIGVVEDLTPTPSSSSAPAVEASISSAEPAAVSKAAKEPKVAAKDKAPRGRAKAKSPTAAKTPKLAAKEPKAKTASAAPAVAVAEAPPAARRKPAGARTRK